MDNFHSKSIDHQWCIKCVKNVRKKSIKFHLCSLYSYTWIRSVVLVATTHKVGSKLKLVNDKNKRLEIWKVECRKGMDDGEK